MYYYIRIGDIFIVHTHAHIHKPEVVVCENYSMKSTYIYMIYILIYNIENLPIRSQLYVYKACIWR